MLPFRMLRALSDGLIRIERVFLMLLIAGIAFFVLINVGFRLFRITLAWADELAVLSMVLAGFVGASLMLRARIDPAVKILQEMLRGPVVRMLRIIVSLIAVVFGLILIWLCWRWFDPMGLVAAGFEIGTFEMTTFNFIYTDTTPVLRWRFFWFYLIMPWFAFTLSVHALNNLAEDLGLIEPRLLAQEFQPGEG
ncbi:MAG: TRAP transporter small permease subunit [Pararhodobacter sp.]|nr:TRAP transporter small permease subunit [Pararhodobacter sp.]